jgi:hypothetical protein
LPARSSRSSLRDPPQAANHTLREDFRLALGVSPEEIVRQFVVNRLHPHPFAVINPSPLPMLRMDQMDTTVLEGLAGGFTPVNILAPFDPRRFDVVKATKIGDSSAENARSLPVKELNQPTIHVSATNYGWNEHPHEL